MKEKSQVQLLSVEGPLCGRCPWRSDCGAMYGDKACRAKWRSKGSGGGQVLHPSFPVTQQFLDAIGGPSFEDISARPTAVPTLPQSIPQIRLRKALRGQLTAPAYAITAGQIIGTRDTPITAKEVRQMVGLSDKQALILLLFGRDEYLEHLWNQRDLFLPALAAAGFDLITAPSYSAWEPRPRPEFFYASKRSLVIFQALQTLGANAIPRLTWTIPFDSERLAKWANRQPALSCVAVDLTTYKGIDGFHEQLRLLNLFDELTGRRLTYIVNGPSRLNRICSLFEAVSVDRVQVTNSRAIAREAAPGVTFREKARTEDLIVASAARAVENHSTDALGEVPPARDYQRASS